jgi:hypothetical protein
MMLAAFALPREGTRPTLTVTNAKGKHAMNFRLFRYLSLPMPALVIALLPGLSGAARAQIPQGVIPDGVGVQIHFITGHERELDMITAAGVKIVRRELEWDKVEQRIGDYDWTEYDELLRNLKHRELRAMLILTGRNANYEPKVKWTGPQLGTDDDGHLSGIAAPRHPESVAAFARFAAAAVKHYRAEHVIWEIENEPNAIFWLPKPDVQEYVNLALATAKAIRSADPDAVIVGPALSGPFPTDDEGSWRYVKQFLSSGILQWLDGITIHAYRDGSYPPESVGSTYARLRQLIDQYAPEDKKSRLPILSGEWGYASSWDGVSERSIDTLLAVTIQMQADFAVRQHLFNLANGVPLSMWYEWVNNDPDPHVTFRTMGLVTSKLERKPVYFALQTMTNELKGFRFDRRLASTPSIKDDFIYRFIDADGTKKIVAWTTSSAHRVSLVDESGARISLYLSGTPLYKPQ